MSRKPVKQYSLFLIASLFSLHTFAQLRTPPSDIGELTFTPNSILPAPAEASSINKGGDVSVNLSIGAPNVVIPIADIKSRFIHFPVTLNYTSNGIRVNELAPYTGLGWSLNCGGAVTRTTLGLPDELRSTYNSDFTNFTKTSVWPMDRATINYLTYTRDRESDLFVFSVNGYISGKFIMDQDFKPKLLSGENYRINLLTTSIKDGFEITDDKGMMFLFTLKDTSYYDRGTCAADPGERVQPIFNTWHLTRIIKPFQDTVYFDYTSNNYEYLADVTQNESVCVTSGVGGCGPGSAATACPVGQGTFTTCKVKQTVNGQILKKIIFANGRLEFEYKDNRQDMYGGKALVSISLRNETDTLKYVRFVTDYGTRRKSGFDKFDTTLQYRLFLRELQIGGSKLSQNQLRYSFGYLNENWLPGRVSTAQDIYGLTNEANAGTGLYFLTDIRKEYPELSSILPNRYADRSVNGETLTAGLLNRITYPTGGADSIIYTPNLHKIQKLIPNQYWNNGGACAATPAGKGDTTYFTVPYTQFVSFSLFVQPNGTIINPHDRGYCTFYKVGDPDRIRRYVTDYESGYYLDSIELDAGDYYVVDSIMRNRMCLERVLWFQAAPDTLHVEEPMGGASVEKIISRDAITGNTQVRQYSYRDRSTGKLTTFLFNENERYVYSNTIRRFMNCEGFTDCVGLSFCSYLVHGGSQIRPESMIGGNYFNHRSVTEIVTGADSIDRCTEHVFSYNVPIFGRVEVGALIPGTPYGIMPDLLLGEKKTSVYSYNRMTHQIVPVQTTVRQFKINEQRLVENFNVVHIFESPCLSTPVSQVEQSSFNVNAYPIYYQRIELENTVDTLYSFDGSGYIVNRTDYEYTGNPYNLLRKSTFFNSKGQIKKSRIGYIFDEPVSNSMRLPLLNRNRIAVTTVIDSIDLQFNRKQLVSYKFAEGNGNIVTDYKIDEQLTNGLVSNISERTRFDQFGNVLEVKVSEKPSVYLWGYKNTNVIAAVTNASYSDVAYTSFEDVAENSWSNPSVVRNITTAVTGDRSFDLSLAGSTGLAKSGLSSSIKYIVSYWTKNASPYSITGTVGVAVRGKLVNGWTYFEHTLNNITSVNVKGSGLIDELRLYPASAMMTTYTHKPLIGITSQGDNKGDILYYEYDTMGRLMVLRDAIGNVLKKFDYKYQVNLGM